MRGLFDRVTALSISTKTRTCPHCAEPMFLVNLEREGHHQLRAYKCLNRKTTSQFAPLSDAPTFGCLLKRAISEKPQQQLKIRHEGELQWTAQIDAEPKPMNVTVSCSWHRAEPKPRS